MNRFKFRAWYSGDIEKGEPLLFEQKEIDHELFFVCKDAPEIMYPFYIPFTDSDWIVEEFTGMKARKGKKGVNIFEGDILKSNDRYYVCEYCPNGGGFRFVAPHFISYPVPDDAIIVGNIHESKGDKDSIVLLGTDFTPNHLTEEEATEVLRQAYRTIAKEKGERK